MVVDQINCHKFCCGTDLALAAHNSLQPMYSSHQQPPGLVFQQGPWPQQQEPVYNKPQDAAKPKEGSPQPVGGYRNAGYPDKLVFALSKFDTTKSGNVTDEEMNTAVRYFEIGKKEENGPWTIPFEAFPETMKRKLVEFDADGNGHLDAGEIEEALTALGRERALRARLLKALVALIVFTALVLLAMGLVTFYVVDLAKEIKTGDDGVLADAATGNPIRVASSDFQVQNGRLVIGTAPCDDNDVCTPASSLPVQVKAASFGSIVSSKLSVDDLRKMTSITAKSEDGQSTVVLTVHGFARFPDITSKEGMAVEIYTHAGVITVDGSSMRADVGLASTLTRAGITLGPDSAARRRSIGGSSRRAVVTSQDLVAPTAQLCLAHLELIRRIANAVNASGGALDLADAGITFPPGYKEILAAMDTGSMVVTLADLAADAWKLSLYKLEGVPMADLHLVEGSTPHALLTMADADADALLSSSEISAMVACLDSVCFNRYPSDAVHFIASLSDDIGGLSSSSDALVDSFDLSSTAIAAHWRDLLQRISSNPAALEWSEADWTSITAAATAEQLHGFDLGSLFDAYAGSESMLVQALSTLDSDGNGVVDAEASFSADAFADFRWAELMCRELAFADGCASAGAVQRRRTQNDAPRHG